MKDSRDELRTKLEELEEDSFAKDLLRLSQEWRERRNIVEGAKDELKKFEAIDKLASPELNSDAQREAVWMLHEYANRIVVFAEGLARCKSKADVYELMAANNDILDLLYRMINVDAILE